MKKNNDILRCLNAHEKQFLSANIDRNRTVTIV